MGTPATISQVGSMWTANNNSGFCTSITINPTNIGDIVAVVIELKYSAASNRTVSGITGTGITWQGTATFQRFMADGVHSVEVWYGTVTATGSHTHTVSYSSTTGQVAGSINGHQLTSTAGSTTVWSVDTTGFNDPNTTANSFPYPALVSALDKECYLGYLAITGSATGNSGGGWTDTTDLRGNWDTLNPNIGNAGTTASHSQSSGSTQLWFTVGVLFQAATASTTWVLAATGLASSSGSFVLNLTKPLASPGLAASTGSFVLNTPQIIAAAGLASSSGSFLLGIPQPLGATGLAASAGSFLMGIPQALAASGLASSTGAMTLGIGRPLAAAGLAASTGTFLMFVGHGTDPFALPQVVRRPNILDCGIWRVFIASRGGGQLLAELDYETFTLGRKLNDVSTCSVTVLAAKNEDCLPILGDLEPFEHEIVAFRNYLPGDAPVWAGPVTLPSWDPLNLVIQARDLFTWLERRTLPFDRSFTSTDLADIFGQYLVDSLNEDASPNFSLLFLGECGRVGVRAVTAVSNTLAGDALRELSRSGVDFTLVGRQMRFGGLPVNTPTTILYDPAIYQDPNGATPKLTRQGLNMATRVVVKGGQDAAGNQVVSTVGFPDGAHGLITQPVSEPLILDALSATHAAADRLAFLNPAPKYLTCQLTPQAPIRFDELVPGIRIDTAFSVGLATALGQFRLQAVDVTNSQAGEAVSLTLVPLVT